MRVSDAPDGERPAMFAFVAPPKEIATHVSISFVGREYFVVSSVLLSEASNQVTRVDDFGPSDG